MVSGRQVRSVELVCLGLSMETHHRTLGANDFAELTLDAGDLDKAAIGLAGCELSVTAD